MSTPTPADIERALSLAILRGIHPPGSRLPTVRELAQAHAVNPGTIQRVVARMQTRGLITARQGSGLKVNDPHMVGDASLVPLWLEALLDDPPRACRVLEDLLVVRRALAVRMFTRYRPQLLARMDALGAAAQAILRADPADLDALCAVDLAFARIALDATGNLVAVAILNTLARVLEDVPLVARAMYADFDRNRAAMTRILQAFLADADDLAEVVEDALAGVDAHTLQRFAALLCARLGGPA